MSSYYRTLLMSNTCIEWSAESTGDVGIDFLQIQWIDCDGITQGTTLLPLVPPFTFCVKGGTSPTIIAVNGTYNLDPSSIVCT